MIRFIDLDGDEAWETWADFVEAWERYRGCPEELERVLRCLGVVI